MSFCSVIFLSLNTVSHLILQELQGLETFVHTFKLTSTKKFFTVIWFIGKLPDSAEHDPAFK